MCVRGLYSRSIDPCEKLPGVPVRHLVVASHEPAASKSYQTCRLRLHTLSLMLPYKLAIHNAVNIRRATHGIDAFIIY